MQNLPPPYPKRNSGWLLPFKAQILMLRSKGYPFYQIAEILQPEAQKQGRKVSASIISYWVSTWRQQEKKIGLPKICGGSAKTANRYRSAGAVWL